MTGAFSWQNCQPLPCFILYSKAKLACYFRYSRLPTFAFQSPMIKRTSFCGVSSGRSCRSSASLALVVGTQTWITVVMNGLSWKQTKIILSAERLHPSTAFPRQSNVPKYQPQIAPKYCVLNSFVKELSKTNRHQLLTILFSTYPLIDNSVSPFIHFFRSSFSIFYIVVH